MAGRPAGRQEASSQYPVQPTGHRRGYRRESALNSLCLFNDSRELKLTFLPGGSASLASPASPLPVQEGVGEARRGVHSQTTGCPRPPRPRPAREVCGGTRCGAVCWVGRGVAAVMRGFRADGSPDGVSRGSAVRGALPRPCLGASPPQPRPPCTRLASQLGSGPGYWTAADRQADSSSTWARFTGRWKL